ncbi:uncharacterized protein TNCV_3722081 [Trichonephila clavipes]|nr:uncharacterized protein TNCV_3722081 [Trichonephila clavipes]
MWQSRENQETFEAYKVSDKIPPFWEEKPKIWFFRAEAQFSSANIKQEETKFNYLVAQLDTKFIENIWDIIQSDEKNKYSCAKLSSDLFSVCVLAIHQNDHQARRRFVEWAQNEIVVVTDFHKRILFSDEAHFWLNGYVNKQNCRICSEANPQVYVETPLLPEKLTVWCALWAGGIIGPYFFKNDEGHNVTVNGDRAV